jgi:hypothetical protein
LDAFFYSKNNTWDKLYACLTDSRLAIYKSSTKDSNSLVQSFEMKLPECKKKVVLEPLPSEIGVNVASSDLPFILKVEMSTDCWPQVSLVLMALSIVDRDKWYKGKFFTTRSANGFCAQKFNDFCVKDNFVGSIYWKKKFKKRASGVGDFLSTVCCMRGEFKTLR